MKNLHKFQKKLSYSPQNQSINMIVQRLQQNKKCIIYNLLMKSILLHQNQDISPRQLFYLPKDILSRQRNSSKFVKLFKNNLSKDFPRKHSLSNNKKTVSTNSSSIKHALNSKIQLQVSQKRKINTENQAAINILSERQRLVKQILNGQIFNSAKQGRKNNDSKKRCKTYDSKQTSTKQDETEILLRMSQRKKLPVNIRMASSRNKQKKDPLDLPSLNSNSISNSNKIALSNQEVIHKYQQFEQKYWSKQFTSIPMSISSVAHSNRKKQQIQNSFRKFSKDAIKRYHNEKMKLGLQNFSKQKFLQQINPQNLSFQSKIVNLQRGQDQAFFKQFLVKRENNSPQKNTDLRNDQQANQKIPKLRLKLSLDDYFKPWQYIQSARNQNNFNPSNNFS